MVDSVVDSVAVLGKAVGGNTYWHYSLTPSQSGTIQAVVAEAERIADISAGADYNVVKLNSDGLTISLLSYPSFFEEAFPPLETAWQIDLRSKSFKRRTYAQSFNPPILHRKELFLSHDHPKRSEYEALTASAEAIGLFENVRTIGFRHAWESLVRERGYRIDGHTLQPLGNDDDEDAESIPGSEARVVERYRTALSRSNLSAPMQILARFGFLDGSKTVFDYGCGRGDDVRNLRANGIEVNFWDPHYAPEETRIPAQIVNLGFVVNVIESYSERVEAVQGAFRLAQELLVVSVMLHNQNSFKGERYEDGVITSRNTFQKYYTQDEMKGFLAECVAVEPFAVAPGIFFLFANESAEEAFRFGQRGGNRGLHLARKVPKEKRVGVRDQRRQEQINALQQLREQWLMLGRAPHRSELNNLDEITRLFGSVNRALACVESETDPELFQRAAGARKDDILVALAMQTFSKRKPFSHLDLNFQRDIKSFFETYQAALEQARGLLHEVSDPYRIEVACLAAAENGLGYSDEEHALLVPASIIERLPPLLRAYIGCASVLYGDPRSSDLVKIHPRSGKLSLMRYDDFYGSPLPKLLERVKINIRTNRLQYYGYGVDYPAPYLYFKSRYLNEEMDGYAAQVAFDEQLAALDLPNMTGHGPRAADFDQMLTAKRWEVNGLSLQRSTTIPDLDARCGENFTFRSLIECGETWERLRPDNQPKNSATYNALFDLATQILDPVIDYFGMVELTYGFASPALTKHISGRIAPKLDQHAACEVGRTGTAICPRLGAAVDFIVKDEDMLEVAEWVAANTPFDRLYFYGDDRPIHVSHGPDNKREFIEMVRGPSGKLIPKRRSLTK
jgi:DNA phosphorothioation-associated putative methyltransferase